MATITADANYAVNVGRTYQYDILSTLPVTGEKDYDIVGGTLPKGMYDVYIVVGIKTAVADTTIKFQIIAKSGPAVDDNAGPSGIPLVSTKEGTPLTTTTLSGADASIIFQAVSGLGVANDPSYPSGIFISDELRTLRFKINGGTATALKVTAYFVSRLG